jgi:uncharacterized protein YkwD
MLLALPAEADAGVKSFESKIVKCANSQRKKHGLAKLKLAAPLAKAARRHARNMLNKGFFDHVDPGGKSPQDRVDAIDRGRWAVGENIAAGYPDVKATCSGWMHSAGHRANILNPAYTHMGAGYAEGEKGYGRYYVQDFAIRLPGL